EALREDDLRALDDADLEALARHCDADGERAGVQRRWWSRRADADDRQPEDGGCDEKTRSHDFVSTLTGMPTLEKSNIHFELTYTSRTQPCDAGYAGTSASSWNAIPPLNGTAHSSHSR